ncbi:MAG: urease accessory protein UreF [Candidatus Acidiferrales bacterium]
MDSDRTGGDPLSSHLLAELRLMHLADSALPIGAVAHSFGLESLVSEGLLTVSVLPDFFRGYLEEAGTMEAAFCREAFRLGAIGGEIFSIEKCPEGWGEKWLEINSRLSALKPARESRAGSAVLGKNFLAAVLALGDFPVLRAALLAKRESSDTKGSAIHHATAFGLAAGALGLGEDRAVLAYLHQSVASLVSACQRLLPLGQTEATRILWNLKPAMIAAAARVGARESGDASCFTPLLDWGAMEHTALWTRLFVS